MQRIESFQVDHDTLEPGLYVSRKDHIDSGTVTTFDLRMKRPNREPVLDNAGLHSFEHLGATLLRNSDWADRTVYFGPMGCRTGFYVLFSGDLSSEDALPLIEDMLGSIVSWEGEVPGASEKECGNAADHDLESAKRIAADYLEVLNSEHVPLEY